MKGLDVQERYSVRAEGEDLAIAEGELDLQAVPALRAGLADSGIRQLDLAGVTFIDSSIVAVLLDAHRARAADGGLRLRDPSTSVRRVLHLSGVDRWIPTEPTDDPLTT